MIEIGTTITSGIENELVGELPLTWYIHVPIICIKLHHNSFYGYELLFKLFNIKCAFVFNDFSSGILHTIKSDTLFLEI
jgi:hypothetical protein